MVNTAGRISAKIRSSWLGIGRPRHRLGLGLGRPRVVDCVDLRLISPYASLEFACVAQIISFTVKPDTRQSPSFQKKDPLEGIFDLLVVQNSTVSGLSPNVRPVFLFLILYVGLPDVEVLEWRRAISEVFAGLSTVGLQT